MKKGVSVEYQYCTALPIGTALAQSWNVELAEGCGDIVGSEMERFGVHFWLAPVLNIHRSILCGRNFEYFSEDPLIGGKMAAALTRGVQKHPGCGTTIKHYCANNSEWGYQGIVMTDWLISLMPADKASPYRKPRASLIAAASGELVMPGDKKDVKDILSALQSGELSRTRLEVNASRLYRIWKKLAK
ncbi:MAG: hypothetical protein E7442_08925 [Ruminococcaceae bacterium]|nr:hypothetical protein [Oscillospiraceae bacterium]